MKKCLLVVIILNKSTRFCWLVHGVKLLTDYLKSKVKENKYFYSDISKIPQKAKITDYTIVRNVIKRLCYQQPKQRQVCLPYQQGVASGPDVQIADRAKSKYMVSIYSKIFQGY